MAGVIEDADGAAVFGQRIAEAADRLLQLAPRRVEFERHAESRRAQTLGDRPGIPDGIVERRLKVGGVTDDQGDARRCRRGCHGQCGGGGERQQAGAECAGGLDRAACLHGSILLREVVQTRQRRHRQTAMA
nr:hypothetical protein [Accumulibacter sp.]